MVSWLLVSSCRFSSGTARIGGGTVDADAFGVVSSVVSSIFSSGSCNPGPVSFPVGWGSETGASRASDLKSGGGERGFDLQLRGG